MVAGRLPHVRFLTPWTITRWPNDWLERNSCDAHWLGRVAVTESRLPDVLTRLRGSIVIAGSRVHRHEYVSRSGNNRIPRDGGSVATRARGEPPRSWSVLAWADWSSLRARRKV